MTYTVSYEDYLASDHFRKLTDKLIYSKPDTKCWICGKIWKMLTPDEYLLFHHVTYENLYHEKLGRDGYVLCSTDHHKVHFYWFFGSKKTPLIKKNLLKRMRYLKMINCIQNNRFVPFLWYGLSCIMS